MCRTREEIIEQEQTVYQIDDHLENNNLEETEKIILKTVRENLIRTIMAEEAAEERSKYPSMLWLAIKKPLAFFPGLFAFLVLISVFFVEEARLYVFALAGVPPFEPEQYMAVSLPLFGFLVITTIIGARK